MDSIINVFFRKASYKIFLECDKDLNVSSISKKIDITYSHVSKILFNFIANDLVVIEKNGREIKTKFTEKGLLLNKELKRILKTLNHEQ